VKGEFHYLIDNSWVHNPFLFLHQLRRVSEVGRELMLEPGVKPDFWNGDALHGIDLKHARNEIPCQLGQMGRETIHSTLDFLEKIWNGFVIERERATQ